MMVTRAAKASPANEMLRNADFLKFALKNYMDYMMSVIEERAIPDFRDGLIPVARRLLWSASDIGARGSTKVKSARIVGDTLGKYHPHGDSSAYNAMVSMTNRNSTFPLIQGDGNWGSMTSPPAAAMRYTEARLSKNSEAVLFNRFYTPLIEFAPNYDGSGREPLVLPAILPVVLLTGKIGMAPGATTNIPSVTKASLIKFLRATYSAGKLDPILAYKTFRFTSTSGGVEVMPTTAEEKAQRMSLFKSTRGKIRLASTFTYDDRTGIMVVTAFADHWKLQTLVEKLTTVPGVAEATDDTNKTDKYGRLVIKFRRGLRGEEAQKLVSLIENKYLSGSQSSVLNFTERYIDDKGQAKAKMRPMSIMAMMHSWIKYRIDLERRACTYWIGEADKQIRKLELLLMACSQLDFLFKLLKSKMSRAEMDAAIAKQFKISTEEAHFITEMKYYQLSRLEADSLVQQRNKILADRKQLENRRSKPLPFMLKQLDELEKSLA